MAPWGAPDYDLQSLKADFDERQGRDYCAPSQAGPGNDINAGSPGFQKAPTRGPASLVAIRSPAEHPGRIGSTLGGGASADATADGGSMNRA
jgi:hypothetical protein